MRPFYTSDGFPVSQINGPDRKETAARLAVKSRTFPPAGNPKVKSQKPKPNHQTQCRTGNAKRSLLLLPKWCRSQRRAALEVGLDLGGIWVKGTLDLLVVHFVALVDVCDVASLVESTAS